MDVIIRFIGASYKGAEEASTTKTGVKTETNLAGTDDRQ